jgi:putative NADPH-quinone reductase
MKKVLLIQGHPDVESFCFQLAHVYKKAASQRAEVKEIIITELDFNPNLQFGYRKRTELEPCLLEAQEKIRWADHIVIIHPVWWGSVPAIFKGFLDRVFLPGFFFKKRPDSIWWDKLLKGKSARIIYTLDTPTLLWWLSGRPSYMALKYTTLWYCGVKPIRGTAIGIIRLSDENKRSAWLRKVERLGEKLK